MRRLAASLVGICGIAVCVLAAQQSSTPISPSEAGNHRGEVVTVCGHPAGFECSSTGTVFNVVDATQLVFRVHIPKTSRRQFGVRLEDRFAQRNVCATGTVDPVESFTQIVVTTVQQFALASGQAPPETVFAPTAYRLGCDPDVLSPKIKKSVKPNYTAEALAAGISGKVELRGVVGADGRVGDVIVVRSLERGLDREAVRAAKGFQFEPATLDGMVVPVVAAFEIEFTIKSR